MLTDDQIQAMLVARAARADGLMPDRILEHALLAGSAPRAGVWRSVLRALGGLAVAAAIVGLVVLGGNLGSPATLGGVGSSGLVSPTASSVVTPAPSVGPSRAPSPTPSATPTPACFRGDLAAGILDWTGAAGSRIADIRLTNSFGTACTVPAIPGLQFLDANGAVLIASPAEAGSPVLIGAGASLTTQVEVGNYCGPAPSLPVTIAFLRGDGGQVVAAPLQNGAEESFAVPPCSGVTPAHIGMNGWKR